MEEILCNLGRAKTDKILYFSCYRDGTIVDTTHLVCLYLLAKLLQAELEKCLRLVTNLPMTDMQNYFGVNYFIYFTLFPLHCYVCLPYLFSSLLSSRGRCSGHRYQITMSALE